MVLYSMEGQHLSRLSQSKFPRERDLQNLIEANLEHVFGCRLIQGEFYTGSEHSGRIDSLALSEENQPVIIEYKNIESDGLVNQALFYLSWLLDHKGDFAEAARKSLGETPIDWSSVRVICIAPNYSRYTLHAVRQMSVRADLELWQFSIHDGGVFQLEKVLPLSTDKIARPSQPAAVSEGSEVERELPTYEISDHRATLQSTDMSDAFDDLLEFVTGLSESVEAVPRKQYIAFKTARNFACLETQRKKMLLYVTLDPELIPKAFTLEARDVSNVGHYGTGNLEIQILTPEDAENTHELLKTAFDSVGGE